MCTVSFLPLPSGGYLLGTNRDESPRRGPGRPPAVLTLDDGTQVLAPTDSDAGGTWVAVDAQGRSLCLLNGDRPAAVPTGDPPSRGLLILDFARDPDPEAILGTLRERLRDGGLGYKAFKLIVALPGQGGASARCVRVAWDGKDGLELLERSGSQVIVSNSFDPVGVEASRGAAFEQLASRAPTESDELARAQAAWHASHAEGEPDGGTRSICMHRPEAASVSFTAVAVDECAVTMTHVAGQPCRGGAPTVVGFG